MTDPAHATAAAQLRTRQQARFRAVQEVQQRALADYDAAQQPLQTRQPHRHQQQALRSVAEVFGEEVVAAAMIDRLVHHVEVIALKGDSYRLRDRDLGGTPTTTDD